MAHKIVIVAGLKGGTAKTCTEDYCSSHFAQMVEALGRLIGRKLVEGVRLRAFFNPVELSC